MVATDRVFELIAEHTTDLVCIHDRENTIRFATPSSKNILGFAPEAIIGKKLTDFLAPEFINEMDFSTLRRFFDHPGARIRYQVRHGENRLRWLESTFTKIEEDSNNYSILSSTRDITESVHLTDDLMTALSSEQKLSRFKANLYSVASHEFKTPLAVIQANIEMLRIKKDNKEILSNSLDSMEEEIDRLNSMIADMLELKKLTMGKTTVKLEKVDVAPLIEDILSKDCKKAYPKVNINHSATGTNTEVTGDYSLIRYIFSNLLINACKFSSNNTDVNVILNFEEKKVRVEIEDKGIGIPQEDQDSIFNSFFRAKNVSNIQGTGVGLSIVKEFVDLHRGKIYFLSTPGEGSTFFVELPYTIAI